MNRHSRSLVVLWAMILCLMGAATPAPAQKNATPAIEQKWRPKEGLYGFHTGKVAPCDSHPLSYVELDKRVIGANEVYKCNIRKITDTAPGLLRLVADCDDETKGKFRDVITLRKIDETSFDMSLRTGRSPSRLAYCRGADETSESNWPYDLNGSEAERKQAEKDGKWEPRYGVYARPGDGFSDRCMKAEDVVVDYKNISLTSGASRCIVTSTKDSSKDYTSLDVVCDQKPGAIGVVMRKSGNLVPPGSEAITMSKSGDHTITFRKSRDGEFSEPAQSLDYCPEAAQRAYAVSKKAK